MRSANNNAVVYSPGNVPDDPAQLPRFLVAELESIRGAVMALSAGHLDKSHAAPDKPRDGDIRFADGTNWNPGSGQGIYAYYGAAWHLLG